MVVWSNEAQVVHAVRKALLKEWPHAWVLKTAGSIYQEPGVPDLLVCVDGRMVGLEVKFQRAGESEAHARGRASVQQRVHIRRLLRAGGMAEVVLTPEEAVAVVRAALS